MGPRANLGDAASGAPSRTLSRPQSATILPDRVDAGQEEVRTGSMADRRRPVSAIVRSTPELTTANANAPLETGSDRMSGAKVTKVRPSSAIARCGEEPAPVSTSAALETVDDGMSAAQATKTRPRSASDVGRTRVVTV